MLVKLKPCDGPCQRSKTKIFRRVGKKGFCQKCWMIVRGTFETKPKKSYQIPKKSNKRAKLDVLYFTLRKSFLSDHPLCQTNIPGVCTGKSQEIHHSYDGKDRERYFLDTTTWFAVDRSCHRWIHENPAEAKELGFLK